MIAESYVGVMEIGGNNQGPEVEEFQKSVNGIADGQPWCMDFVQFCVKQVENNFNWAARIKRSESVISVWMGAEVYKRKALPSRGAIAIWQKIGTAHGHCGIVVKVMNDGKTFETVEGNTSPGKTVEREGDGVYEKTRLLSSKSNVQLGTMRLLGFLDAF